VHASIARARRPTPKIALSRALLALCLPWRPRAGTPPSGHPRGGPVHTDPEGDGERAGVRGSPPATRRVSRRLWRAISSMGGNCMRGVGQKCTPKKGHKKCNRFCRRLYSRAARGRFGSAPAAVNKPRGNATEPCSGRGEFPALFRPEPWRGRPAAVTRGLRGPREPRQVGSKKKGPREAALPESRLSGRCQARGPDTGMWHQNLMRAPPITTLKS
jgi:hypothetical protein